MADCEVVLVHPEEEKIGSLVGFGWGFVSAVSLLESVLKDCGGINLAFGIDI